MIPGHERRGIAFNNAAFVGYFAVPGTHATWCYNWDSYSPPRAPTAWYAYVPMLSSLTADHTGPWQGRVEQAVQDADAADAPLYLLGFNEPDNCGSGGGGSCISVSDAVAGWKQYMEPFKGQKDDLYLCSPAVTNAADTDTTGLGWLRSFIGACTGCNIDVVTIRWYDRADNAAYFKQHIEDTRAVAGGRPIWVTEFKPSGTDDEIKSFLDEVLPWMDGSSDIHRYAYFMATSGAGMLVNDAQTDMSDLGQYYNFHQ